MKLSAISQRINALLLLLTVVLLSGCGTQRSQPVVEYRTISQTRLNLPAELTGPISVPEPRPGLSYGDSVELNMALYGVAQQCNIDRAGIRRIESAAPLQ